MRIVFFLLGASMLNNVLDEESIGPIWRCKDLTTDATMLRGFLEEITGAHVTVEAEWADRAVRRLPTNSHRSAKTPVPEFAPWQIEAIREIVHPEA